MEYVLSISTLMYCLFGLFLFNQQSHLRDFKGESQITLLLLNLFVTAGVVTALIYFGLLWYKTHWYTAIIVFIVNLVFGGLIGYRIEKLLSRIIISMLGFIALPLLGFLMFYYMPELIK